VLDELADGVVEAVDLVVFWWGGTGGGGWGRGCGRFI